MAEVWWYKGANLANDIKMTQNKNVLTEFNMRVFWGGEFNPAPGGQ